MNEILFTPLEKDFLKTHVQQFIDMCQRNMEEEYWNENNFLTDLPGKWDYSFYAADSKNTLNAFIIASEKEQSVHIHKFVVDAPFQRSGMGTNMLSRIIKQSRKPLTLKVRTDNTRGVAFYQRNHFVISGTHNELYTMTRPLML